MFPKLTVKTIVAVDEDCPILYNLIGAEGAEFVFNTPPHDNFELSLTAGALRQFIDIATKALEELEVTSCTLASIGG